MGRRERQMACCKLLVSVERMACQVVLHKHYRYLWSLHFCFSCMLSVLLRSGDAQIDEFAWTYIESDTADEAEGIFWYWRQEFPDFCHCPRRLTRCQYRGPGIQLNIDIFAISQSKTNIEAVLDRLSDQTPPGGSRPLRESDKSWSPLIA